MSSLVRQHPILAAVFFGCVVLSMGLPVDQFVELAGLAIQVGISIAAACLALFVAPGLIFGDWLQSVIHSVRTLRLAQGWIPAQQLADACAPPTGTPSVLLPPPRSIS